MAQQKGGSAPGAAFSEGQVEADGFLIRYLSAGEGPVLIHLHGAGGLRLTRGHDLLSRQFRVIAFEMPGFGASPENAQTRSQAEMAATMGAAAAGLGLGCYNLMGTSFGGRTALYLAAQQPQQVSALVLEAPAAIRPAGARPPSGSPEDIARLIHAHPERLPPPAAPDPLIQAKNARLLARLRGPDRDPELEALLRGVTTPTLALFGTLDRLMPCELGRHYKTLLPNCELVLVYDAGHAISTDRPEAFAEVVADFFTRREAFVISRNKTVIHP